ncbi:unnamed protein product [Onchocerca flexuosa]|uniref:BRCT domain-containing protein n=1 Tax=Onchocerca flexuosa TaxID=387005 RepID=A0A183GY67_9BILA|nr:unnamed protein product [Onchocerca flexuosa]
MACSKLKKRSVTDEVFESFANEFGQRSIMLSEAGRNIDEQTWDWSKEQVYLHFLLNIHIILGKNTELTYSSARSETMIVSIRKRLLLKVPQNELKWRQCNDDLCKILLDASKMLLKNILEEALKMKRSHLMSSTGICHMFGARKRRIEGDRFTDSYVLLSMKTPLCTTDIIDALRADCRFISNTWIRQLLVERFVGMVSKKKFYVEEI